MRFSKWQFPEAKKNLGEIVKKATEEGPQTIIGYGKDSVVIISDKEYKNNLPPSHSLVDFFQHSPLADVELKLERDKSSAREFYL